MTLEELANQTNNFQNNLHFVFQFIPLHIAKIQTDIKIIVLIMFDLLHVPWIIPITWTAKAFQAPFQLKLNSDKLLTAANK